MALLERSEQLLQGLLAPAFMNLHQHRRLLPSLYSIASARQSLLWAHASSPRVLSREALAHRILGLFHGQQLPPSQAPSSAVLEKRQSISKNCSWWEQSILNVFLSSDWHEVCGQASYAHPVPFTALTSPLPHNLCYSKGQRSWEWRSSRHHSSWMPQLSHFRSEWVTLVEPHAKDLPPQDGILLSKSIWSWNYFTCKLFWVNVFFKK